MEPDLKKLIEEAVKKEATRYPASLAIENIRQVYSGKIWIVGGYISNIAIPLIHGYSLDKPTDVDIVIQGPFDCSSIPDIEGWKRTKTFHGGLRYLKGKEGIDIWTLQQCSSIIERGLDLTIENYLLTVPLTIQALAYDFEKKELYNDVGLRAVETRTVGINNAEDLMHAVRRISPWQEYLQEKANKLKLKAVF